MLSYRGLSCPFGVTPCTVKDRGGRGGGAGGAQMPARPMEPGVRATDWGTKPHIETVATALQQLSMHWASGMHGTGARSQCLQPLVGSST